MKKILILIAVLSLTACGTTSKFVYPSNSKNVVTLPEGKNRNKKVAVVPFEDSRSDKNSEVYLLSYIPLFPVGWASYERPDAAKRFLTVGEFTFTPSEDLAKAAAYSLKKSGLFSEAFFSYGADKDKADYVLEGEILSTKYDGKIITYGFSVYGSLFWLVGLPAGTSNNELSLSFKLKDSKTNQVLWKNQYDLKNSMLQGAYYNWGRDVKSYSSMMEEIMNKVVQDISRDLKV
jgi:hypothetical protein